MLWASRGFLRAAVECHAPHTALVGHTRPAQLLAMADCLELQRREQIAELQLRIEQLSSPPSPVAALRRPSDTSEAGALPVTDADIAELPQVVELQRRLEKQRTESQEAQVAANEALALASGPSRARAVGVARGLPSPPRRHAATPSRRAGALVFSLPFVSRARSVSSLRASSAWCPVDRAA